MSPGDPGNAPASETRTQSPLAELLTRFDLEELDRDLFLGHPGDEEGRIFGGLVAAQSTMAVGRTVEDGTLHSLHAYFLRPGEYGRPIRFVVDRIRDGRTFTTRRVVALQNGEAIFNLSASFARPEEGIAHQTPMPEAPEPESLPTFAEMRSHWYGEPPPREITHGPLEIRLEDEFSEQAMAAAGEQDEVMRRVWMRLTGPPPDDPLERIALLVYASDRTLMGSAFRASGLRPGRGLMLTSLDHALWLHEPPCLDDWFLYTSTSPVARSGRALVHGVMYERGGNRIASVTQEGLLRVVRKRKTS